MKTVVATEQAPKAIGPYSQAIICNGFVFLSGQVPFDPATGQIVDGDIGLQTERVLNNLKAVLDAAGSSLDQVVKTTVFLKDMGDFAKMNETIRYVLYAKSARSLDSGSGAPAPRRQSGNRCYCCRKVEPALLVFAVRRLRRIQFDLDGLFFFVDFNRLAVRLVALCDHLDQDFALRNRRVSSRHLPGSCAVPNWF